MNEGTFATGAQMFEMPVVRVSIADGAPTRLVPGETVDYSVSVTRDGRTMVYRAVEGRTMGDLFVQDLATGVRRQMTDVNPQLKALARRLAAGDQLALVRRHGDLGICC